MTGGQAQPQGRGTSYGRPDPYRRAYAYETQEISQAYASQQVYQSRPNVFASMQRTGGAGHGYLGTPAHPRTKAVQEPEITVFNERLPGYLDINIFDFDLIVRTE